MNLFTISDAQALFTKRDNGEGYCFKFDARDRENPLLHALSDVIGRCEADHDSAYAWTVEVLDILEEIYRDDEVDVDFDTFEERIQQEEPPIYNHELLSWLAKGTNYCFVDEYFDEYGDLSVSGLSGGIIQCIQGAYALAYERHATAVFEALEGVEEAA